MEGRVAVVTGVGRTAGIGFATARRLLDNRHRVLVHSYRQVIDAEGGFRR
jgi:NAD(P)-dependent dehydrogenase (short-subunit alcohol dehydrogenase family)